MATDESVDRLVIKTVASICGMEDSKITPATTLGELAMDSLRITALSADIQAAYECPVTPGDVVELLEAVSIADLVAVVRRITDRPVAA